MNPLRWPLVCREEGQDMVEYSLLASLLGIAAITALTMVGPLLVSAYAWIRTAFRIRSVVG